MLSSLLHQVKEHSMIDENKYIKNMKLTDISTNENKKSQFSMFHDYLGLINLIQPSSLLSPLDSPSSEEGSVNSLFNYQTNGTRRRIDSYDSDSISDSSSSGGSRSDTEMFFDNNNVSTNDLIHKATHSLPLLSDSNISSALYAQRLESLLAKKSALSHLQSVIGNKSTVKTAANKASVCVFCRNNGESREFYSSHTLKDNEGNTTCPILRAYTCPLCKASGDQSHTIKYCPNYTPKVRADKLLNIGI